MSLTLLVDGPLTALHTGDRFEIAADLTTDAVRLVRQDYSGNPASLVFDFGARTSVVFRVAGPVASNAKPAYLENALKPLELVYRRSRRFT